MFKFLRTDQDKKTPVGSPLANSSPPVSGRSQSPSTTVRELIRVVLRDSLRGNGIPTDWIGCELTPRSDDSEDGGQLIQLVINRWHEELMAYTPLLQQQFLQGLQRFDPTGDHSRHLVVWKFSRTCGYPRTAMPSPEFWLAKPTAPAKAKFDLPPSSMDALVDDFAPTVPGEFR